jgi:hypothetical protein
VGNWGIDSPEAEGGGHTDERSSKLNVLANSNMNRDCLGKLYVGFIDEKKQRAKISLYNPCWDLITLLKTSF